MTDDSEFKEPKEPKEPKEEPKKRIIQHDVSRDILAPNTRVRTRYTKDNPYFYAKYVSMSERGFINVAYTDANGVTTEMNGYQFCLMVNKLSGCVHAAAQAKRIEYEDSSGIFQKIEKLL